MARVKVVLHGYLSDLHDEETYIEGTDVAEIINGFCKQTGAFDVPLGEEKHQIRVHGFDDINTFYQPLSKDVKELHLMPDLRGGKGGGFFKIVLGAVLIAAAIFLPPIGIAAGVTLNSILFGIGASLVLGGLLELLSPAPQIDTLPDSQDPEASKYLGADKNTVKIGTRIPLLYGRHLCFGHYLSFNVDAKDVSL